MGSSSRAPSSTTRTPWSDSRRRSASPRAAREVAESDAYAADVADDIRLAHALGVTGVPFFALDRRFGISGAQPTELFVSALERARDEASVPS